MNKHCQAAKDHLAVAESGDAKTAAYRKAAEEIEQAIERDGLTQQQVADQIGKSARYVGMLLRALTGARSGQSQFMIDWQSGSNKRADTQRPTEIAKWAPRDRAELAANLMSDPVVVRKVLAGRTKAASNVRTAVSKENAAERARSLERAEQERQATAMPIGSIFTGIADKLDEWSRALADLEDDLIEARDQFGVSIVITALRMHSDTCARLADRMELDATAVIEK